MKRIYLLDRMCVALFFLADGKRSVTAGFVYLVFQGGLEASFHQNIEIDKYKFVLRGTQLLFGFLVSFLL